VKIIRMLNIVTMCANPFAHEKLIVNIKYGPTKHHYKKNRAKQTTPRGAKCRLGSKPTKIQSSIFNENSMLLESRGLADHSGIVFERIRCVFEVLYVEEVGEFEFEL